MREPEAVERVERPHEAGFALVEQMVVRRRHEVEARIAHGLDPGVRRVQRERLAVVEVADGVRRPRDRRLEHADGEIGCGDVRFRIREIRGEIVAVACPAALHLVLEQDEVASKQNFICAVEPRLLLRRHDAVDGVRHPRRAVCAHVAREDGHDERDAERRDDDVARQAVRERRGQGPLRDDGRAAREEAVDAPRDGVRAADAAERAREADGGGELHARRHRRDPRGEHHRDGTVQEIDGERALPPAREERQPAVRRTVQERDDEARRRREDRDARGGTPQIVRRVALRQEVRIRDGERAVAQELEARERRERDERDGDAPPRRLFADGLHLSGRKKIARKEIRCESHDLVQ